MSKALSCILLVDDSQATNLLNKRVLMQMKVCDQIDEVGNGKEALDYILKNTKKNADQVLPDLIFLDITMPVVDGFEFLEECKDLAINLKNTVVIMLTSSFSPQDELRARELGVDGFTNKPLTQEKITEIITEHF